jgi:hypothetical protein
MNEEKNKRKVHYDSIDPELFSDLKKDYKKYKVTPEAIENAKRMATLIGDSFVVRIDKDTYLRALLGSMYRELNEPSPMDRMYMYKVPCVDESAVEDPTKFGMVIHRDGIDLNLRGMRACSMSIDLFNHEIPDPPERDIVSIIKSVDYDRIEKLLTTRRHTHYLFDSSILRYLEEKGDTNVTYISKINGISGISSHSDMYAANNHKIVPTTRRRHRHR